jgi:hypothetical protein
MLATGRWASGINVPKNALWTNSGTGNRKNF